MKQRVWEQIQQFTGALREERVSKTLFFLFAVLLLSIVPFFRALYYEGWPAGELPYYHMRMGTTFLEEGIPHEDTGVFLSRSYSLDPLDILMGFIGLLFGMKGAALLVPPLLGLVTLFFLYALLGMIFPSPKQRLIAGIFLAANPLFLTLFSELTNLTIISAVTAAGLYFFVQKKKTHWLAFVFFPLLLFYEIYHSIIAVSLLLILSSRFSSQKRREGIFLSSILLFGILIVFFTKQISIVLINPSFLGILQSAFSDVGGKFGFSFFAVFLAIIGFWALWKTKKIPSSFLGLCFFLLLLTLFVSFVYALYLQVFITIAATVGFFVLLKREWKIPELKNITLFLVILGLLFSATTVISRNATAFPDKETMSALSWLKQNSADDAVVLTAEKYGFVVEQAVGRKVVLDKLNPFAPETEQVREELQTLWYTRQLETAMAFLEKYHVKYIVVFADMRTGIVWKKEHQGLLFLLENGENFKKVFENDKVTIWRVYAKKKG